jgi:uncharacterized protein YndB with AHSA1/START domain
MTDRGDTRVIDLSVEVPGSPEEVWKTISTGPGITSWYVPHQVEERPGGTVRMDFGPAYGEHTAEVAVWEPPRRVVFAGSGETEMAFEWLVTDRHDGTCGVRLVNSGFAQGEEGDAELDAMRSGWSIFLENLRLHLTHFRGRRAHAVIPTVMTTGPHDSGFSRLCAALGIPDDLRDGARVVTSGEGVPALAGTLDRVLETGSTRTYLVLLDSPTPGTAFLTAEGWGDLVSLSAYLYLYGPAPEGFPDRWSTYLAEQFPPEAPAP